MDGVVAAFPFSDYRLKEIKLSTPTKMADLAEFFKGICREVD